MDLCHTPESQNNTTVVKVKQDVMRWAKRMEIINLLVGYRRRPANEGGSVVGS